MAESTQATTIARERVEDLAFRLPEPAWLRDSRIAAWEAYLQTPAPNMRSDEWRRTLVEQLDPGGLVAVDPGQLESSTDHLPFAFRSVLEHFPQRAGVLCQVSGQPGYQEVATMASEQGAIFAPLNSALKTHPDLICPYLTRKAGFGKFDLMNDALFNCGLFLYVPQGVEIDLPFLSGIGLAGDPSGQGLAIFPRILVVAEAASRATLINVMGSTEPGKAATTQASSLANGCIQVFTGNDASVNYLELQNYASNVFLIDRNYYQVGRNGSLSALTVALGGRQIKGEITTALQEPGAASEVLGLVFGKGKESYSFNTHQEHNAADTTSDINFRVALKDAASAVYQGTIKVAKAAQRTDAYQSNKNLLLGSEAKADSIPRLEILADDVKCSHGATVGPVDKEQLFYLMSRGLTKAEAEELIVFGFFRQILERVKVPEATEWLTAAISRQIHQIRG